MKLKLTLALALAAAVCTEAAAQTADRNAAWREDLRVARTVFLPKDLSYARDQRSAAEALLEQLSRDVPRLSDAELAAGLARAAALSNNAHTRAYLLRNAGVWRRYPIRIWKFADGWRVIAARPDQAGLLGAEIVAVAGRPMARAETAVRPLFAGNENWAEYMAGYSLTSPDALIGTGLASGSGATVFELRKDGRRVTRSLAPDPDRPPADGEENWWYLSPAHPATRGWVQVLQGRPLPAALAGADQQLRFLRCGDVAYVQLNRADDTPNGETMNSFAERVLGDLKAAPPRRLVLDLRFNTGGNLDKGWAFFRELAASPLAQERGRTLVLVGPTTFSAGITHVAQMRQFSKALLAGTAPGDVLETWSEGSSMPLPNSKIRMRYTERAHTYSLRPHGLPKERVHLNLDVPHLLPDVPADWSWAEYAAGRDPYLEKALGGPLQCPAQSA